MKEEIKNFLELTRAYALGLSITPVIVATIWASAVGVCKFRLILTILALVCLHLGGNLFDDLIDIYMKLKEGIKLSDINFEDGKGKARLIINGRYSLKMAWLIDILLFIVACLIGAYFYIIFGTEILYFTIIGALLILLYPISSKFYLSEIIIGYLFGILAPQATFFVLTGNESLNLTHFSLSMALLIAGVAHTHSIMDWEHDEKNNKRTLAQLFKTKKNAIRALGWMTFVAYLNLAILISMYFLPSIMILTFITTPIAVELINSMKKYIILDNSSLEPRWWMGIMENWKEIQNNNQHYFMYRFYLSRNLAVYFSIISAICYAIAVNFPING